MKRFRMVVSVMALASVAGLVLSGCGASTPSPSSQGSTKKPITIGWSVYGLQAEFAVLLNNGVKHEAKKLGVKVITENGNYDAATQNSQMQTLISDHVNAIVMDPISYTAEVPVVKQALSQHIPVVGVNTTEATHETSYVGSHDPTAGRNEMQVMAKALHGHGNIVILQGPIGQSATNGRNSGIAAVLKKYPGIHVLAKQTANWQRNQALTLMQNWLASYGHKINGVVAENDDMAAGAISAMKSQGLAGKIPVVGVDGIIAGLKNIQKGYELETQFQNAYVQAEDAVKLAVEAAKGKHVPQNVRIPFVPVTKANVSKYLAMRYKEEGIKP